MRTHPNSELHQCGKMFGVLVYGDGSYIAAFSAKLDGSYFHEGFVPPVYEIQVPPVGKDKKESQRLQQLLFANYHFINKDGEDKSLLEIFADEKPILSPEEWFDKSRTSNHSGISLPPSGAGECCAPKLLQYAFSHGLEPVAMAEFWVGAPSRSKVRKEGVFYAPCSGKCVPILRHMLREIKIDSESQEKRTKELLKDTEIIYDDRYLMVLNKPSGVLSTPGKGEVLSMEEYIRTTYGLPYCQSVHRLDQDTSGLLVLAKNPDVYKELQSYFQRRDILKRYEAVISCNHEIPAEGTISLPLLPNPFDRPRQMVDLIHGKPSFTRYSVREKRNNGTYLIDFYPLTGRTHQIRVHAAHPDGLNAPIVGDRLYGTAGERLMLHAAEINFVHPITQERMHFCIPSMF